MVHISLIDLSESLLSFRVTKARTEYSVLVVNCIFYPYFLVSYTKLVGIVFLASFFDIFLVKG